MTALNKQEQALASRSRIQVETPAILRRRISVAMGLDPSRALEQATLLDEARDRGWRWHLAREHHPVGTHTRGALVDWLPNDPRIKLLYKHKCHVVRIGKLPHPDDANVPAVLPDLSATGRMAADYFKAHDLQDVAFFGHAPWGNSKILFEGYQQRTKEIGLRCHLYQIKRQKGESPREATARQNHELLDRIMSLPRPLALLAPGAAVAANFCNLLIEAGIDVPEDVAILAGTDSRVFCECMSPSISAINTGGNKLLHAACDLLDNLIHEKPIPNTPIFVAPTEITERESTRVTPTGDKQVTIALRYMWDNLDRNISVEEIATYADLSPRQLNRRFQKALNRGINEEFRRLRLKEFARLLCVTSYTIEELAPLVGFQSKVYLHRAFRQTFGMTPAQYRKQQS